MHFAYNFKDRVQNFFLRKKNNWNFVISIFDPKFLNVVLVQNLNEIFYNTESLSFHLALLNRARVLYLLSCYVLRV